MLWLDAGNTGRDLCQVSHVDGYNVPSLNGANTVKSPVAWGFSGIVARFCLSFCGTVFVIGDGGPAASIRAAVAPVFAPVCFFIEIRGTAAKGFPGLLRGSEEGSTRKKACGQW